MIFERYKAIKVYDWNQIQVAFVVDGFHLKVREFSGKGRRALDKCVMWRLDGKSPMSVHHFSFYSQGNSKVSLFEYFIIFSSPTVSSERKFDLTHGLGRWAKPTFPFPRLLTRSTRNNGRFVWQVMKLLLSNSEYFSSIDQNLQSVRIAFQMGRLCSRRAAIFSRTDNLLSFNLSICSVVIWNLLSYSPILSYLTGNTLFFERENEKGNVRKGFLLPFHHIPFIHNQILLHPSQACRAFILIHSEELHRSSFDALLAEYQRQFHTSWKDDTPIATDMETGGPSRALQAAVAMRALTP